MKHSSDSMAWKLFDELHPSFAEQASQVFYANNNSNRGWQVVRKTKPHDSSRYMATFAPKQNSPNIYLSGYIQKGDLQLLVTF